MSTFRYITVQLREESLPVLERGVHSVGIKLTDNGDGTYALLSPASPSFWQRVTARLLRRGGI